MRWESPPLSEGRWPEGPEGSLALVGLIRPPSGATFPTSGEGFSLNKPYLLPALFASHSPLGTPSLSMTASSLLLMSAFSSPSSRWS